MGSAPTGASGERIDPERVQTLPELAHALDQLRGARSYKDMDRAAKSRGGLPGSTISNLLSGRSVPTRNTLVTFLTACGLDGEAQGPWLAAWERVATSHLRAPVGAVRVREARPRLLGVHAAIRVEGAGGELPSYVPRDLDADLRTALTAAAERGGFVLLVGGSSVGKTRTLLEAVRAVVPEWWLLHPADAEALGTFSEQSTTPRTVVWLDELQRYLSYPGGLPVGTVRGLIGSGVMVTATLWPDEYTTRTAARTSGRPDPYANDRELLDLAQVVHVPEMLTVAERRRAEAMADDPRIRVALDTRDAGFTQVLAAGPALVAWWENAPAEQCYGQAVITAALDARRVGAQAPLSREFLAAAAPAYLTPAQQATAPGDWLDHALTYATTPLHGATSTLTPVPAGMGRIAGYTVADYLHQHARRIRRSVHLPDLVWQALVDHHPMDTRRLADSAERRGRKRYAEALYRHGADAGDRSAARRLTELLAAEGRVDELRARADAGDEFAADRLGDLLAEQGRVEEAIAVLRARADAGDRSAANRLGDLLAEQGRVDELRARADAGDRSAADRLGDLLAEQGRVDELQARADAGDRSAADRLGDLLAEQGRIDELRARADGGNSNAAHRLAKLLAAQGRVDELRVRADAGDQPAAFRLAELLAEQGRIEEAITVLRVRADAGDLGAAFRLTGLLFAQKSSLEVEEAEIVRLRGRADFGDLRSAFRLAGLLAKKGRVEELRARADAGDWQAAVRLAELLAEQGRIDELRARADAGNIPAVFRLGEVLAAQGRVDEAIAELRPLADAGDQPAAFRLAELLAEQGRVEEAIAVLRARVDAPYGDGSDADRLADLLAAQGRVDELRALADAGEAAAAGRLIELLAEQGRVKELDQEVAAGTRGAGEFLERLQRR